MNILYACLAHFHHEGHKKSPQPVIGYKMGAKGD